MQPPIGVSDFRKLIETRDPEGRAYWVNASDNALIKELLIRSTPNFKMQFECLLQDQPIRMLINEQMVFTQLESSESTVWTLILMCGYLKAKPVHDVENNALFELWIPNKEVKLLYATLIAEWLSGVNNATVFNTFLNNLLNGEMSHVEEHLQNLMLQT